jgi:uncharacterized protein (TIGR01777 family)
LSPLSELGLIEMTRKRTRESLQQILCQDCPTCKGKATIKTPETVCYEIFREIMRVSRAFENRAPRAVIHLAGEQAVGKRFTESYKRRILDSRVKTGELLVRAIAQVDAPPAVLLSASGVDYYASDANGADTPIDETAPPGTEFLSQVCVAWEGAVAGATAHGARVTFLRCGAVLGRGGGSLATMALPFKMFVGGSLGSGRQLFSWVHLEDAVRAFEHALDDASLSGPVNVVAPNAVRWDDLARALGAALHRPSFFPVPSFALKALFASGAAPILTGRRAVPTKLERAGFAFRYPTIEQALAEALD